MSVYSLWLSKWWFIFRRQPQRIFCPRRARLCALGGGDSDRHGAAADPSVSYAGRSLLTRADHRRSARTPPQDTLPPCVHALPFHFFSSSLPLSLSLSHTHLLPATRNLINQANQLKPCLLCSSRCHLWWISGQDFMVLRDKTRCAHLEKCGGAHWCAVFADDAENLWWFGDK